MLKQDVINAIQEVLVAEGTKVSKATVKAHLDALQTVVEGAIARGEEVRLTGFFTVSTKEVAERTAKNPQNGEDVVVPAHTKASIKLASALRKA